MWLWTLIVLVVPPIKLNLVFLFSFMSQISIVIFLIWSTRSRVRDKVHHKDMDKVPGKNPPGTLQAHSECSQPVSLQCSWVRKWLVHSQCPRLWEHSKFSQRKYPEFSWAVHSKCSQSMSLQCSRSCDQDVPIRNTGKIVNFPKESTQNFHEWLIQNFLCSVPSQ